MASVKEYPFVATTMPAGYTIHFYERLGRKTHVYRGDWQPEGNVDSVTQILDCLAKPALTWWGQTIGLEGAQELLRAAIAENGDPVDAAEWFLDESTEGLTAALTAGKLTVNHQREKAADRGTDVHAAAEEYLRSREKLELPEDQQPYFDAFLKWCQDYQPTPIHVEQVVASKDYNYAGTTDLIARIDNELVVVDFKTSKKVYPEMMVQVEAYRLAAAEAGFGITDGAYILRLGKNGTYEYVRSTATFDQFLAVKGAFDAMKALKS